MASSQIPYDVLYSGSVVLAGSTFVPGITYGIMTSLYSVCMYNLVGNLRSHRATGLTPVLTAWITALWVLASISTITNASYCIYAYSWQMGYPDGPTAFLAASWNKPVPLLASSTYVITMWIADSMVLWRVFVFCRGIPSLARSSILCFVSLIYLGVVGTGCYLIQAERSNQSLNSNATVIPCFSLSVTLNVFATLFISTRLFMFKRQMEKSLGYKEASSSPYATTAAMLIESAALYATWSLVYIIVYVLNSPGNILMLMTLCDVQAIAPLLIIYRVSKGTAWEQTSSTKLTLTRMSFSNGMEAKSDVMCDSEHSEVSTSGAGSASLSSGVKGNMC